MLRPLPGQIKAGYRAEMAPGLACRWPGEESEGISGLCPFLGTVVF